MKTDLCIRACWHWWNLSGTLEITAALHPWHPFTFSDCSSLLAGKQPLSLHITSVPSCCPHLLLKWQEMKNRQGWQTGNHPLRRTRRKLNKKHNLQIDRNVCDYQSKGNIGKWTETVQEKLWNAVWKIAQSMTHKRKKEGQIKSVMKEGDVRFKNASKCDDFYRKCKRRKGRKRERNWNSLNTTWKKDSAQWPSNTRVANNDLTSAVNVSYTQTPWKEGLQWPNEELKETTVGKGKKNKVRLNITTFVLRSQKMWAR